MPAGGAEDVDGADGVAVGDFEACTLRPDMTQPDQLRTRETAPFVKLTVPIVWKMTTSDPSLAGVATMTPGPIDVVAVTSSL